MGYFSRCGHCHSSSIWKCQWAITNNYEIHLSQPPKWKARFAKKNTKGKIPAADTQVAERLFSIYLLKIRVTSLCYIGFKKDQISCSFLSCKFESSCMNIKECFNLWLHRILNLANFIWNTPVYRCMLDIHFCAWVYTTPGEKTWVSGLVSRGLDLRRGWSDVGMVTITTNQQWHNEISQSCLLIQKKKNSSLFVRKRSSCWKREHTGVCSENVKWLAGMRADLWFDVAKTQRCEQKPHGGNTAERAMLFYCNSISNKISMCIWLCWWMDCYKLN